MENTIYHIYDKIFKKILTLSSKSVVNLINGLFNMDYSDDSTIQYNWTEFEDDELKRILADTILTINNRKSYHLEAQMTNDETIVFRVFEYGFFHADRNRISDRNLYELKFPEPKIIYLSPDETLPSEYLLRLDFGTQGIFNYKVKAFIFNKFSTEELSQKKMIILIPFKLLKLRKALEKSRSPENLTALKNLIQNDIIGSIEENLRLGNITLSDARKLKRLTHKLYQQIYSHYKEMEEMNEMTDESLMLDIDIIEKEHEQQLAEKDNALLEKDKALLEKDNTLHEKDNLIEKKESEILALQERIKELEKQLKENL